MALCRSKALFLTRKLSGCFILSVWDHWDWYCYCFQCCCSPKSITWLYLTLPQHPVVTPTFCMSSLIKAKGKKNKKNKTLSNQVLPSSILIYHSTLPAPLFISLVNWSWVWATCQTSSMYRGFFHVRWLKWVYRNHWSIISSHGNIKLQVIHWGFCFFKSHAANASLNPPPKWKFFYLVHCVCMFIYREKYGNSGIFQRAREWDCSWSVIFIDTI